MRLQSIFQCHCPGVPFRPLWAAKFVLVTATVCAAIMACPCDSVSSGIVADGVHVTILQATLEACCMTLSLGQPD